ncbi:MAG: hypothetical protein JRI57_05585 [Deltaproteobacteria bacterium]|nr:hypothetical protein [Deltaproteobacteria bacterium]MBW1951547.1 hypothetical protein [Deltaproteobacteria bacterium]MBW2135214.1 hypothetical protein [Deltaproteobacteria bacterium]
MGNSFVALLDQPLEQWPVEIFAHEPVPNKAFFQPPLFALGTAPEYQVTMAIIAAVNNPYLQFVHSPAEILLCGPLFKLNPALNPELLGRFHFLTLWQRKRLRGPGRA